ncbi:hypothetical protein [Fulvimonas yonginensis]|uniref:Uncharacterized protein n=1 Tax=Fulvimonas yonginensis TaxID=1495200 RepID=A0ABU8JEY2_9GAMM
MGPYLMLAATAAAGTTPVAAPPDVAAPYREADWRGARRVALAGGGELRLLRSGKDVYVAVHGPARGYPSLCVGGPGRVDILHASAALGTVSYLHAGGAWRLQQPFAWQLRDQGGAQEAPAGVLAARRAAFFRQHGWLSTASVAGAPVRMFRIRLDATRQWLGVVFLDTATMHTSYWPASMGPACRNLPLVKGDAPAALDFDPASWSSLEDAVR